MSGEDDLPKGNIKADLLPANMGVCNLADLLVPPALEQVPPQEVKGAGGVTPVDPHDAEGYHTIGGT